MESPPLIWLSTSRSKIGQMRKVSSPLKKIPGQPSLLGLRWEKTLKKNSRRVLLIDAASGAQWTAKALDNEADKFAGQLSQFEKGAKIAFCLPNGAPWMALFLALQKLGLAAVPLDVGLPGPACLKMAQSLGCCALFHHGKWQVLNSIRRKSAAVCCMKVTSGTSGTLPKNVPCLAEHLIADGTNIIRTMDIRAEDRNLAAIPLGHSYGLGNFVMPLILQGTSLVCAERFVPRQLIEWITLYRVTVFPSVPAIFRIMASMPGRSRLKPLRMAISAGAPLTSETAQAFFQRYHLKIHNFYGSSETGGICYDRKGDASLSGRSVGKPLAGVVLSINRGSIVVKSGAVAKPRGCWCVPDHGEWNDQGELVLRGRRGREINIGGKKVHPSEIEQVLRGVSGISDAMAWVKTSSERPFIYAAVESRLSLANIQQALLTRLPEWKLPKYYLIRTELPRTARGKIDMTAVRQEIEK